MLLTRLKLDYFGKFTNKELELKPGINLIYGENEAGKSTLHAFIKGILFGIERLRGRGARSKEDTYTRYLPWEYPGAYGGQMDIEINNKKYRLQRSFHANDKSFIILELETGRELKLKDDHISELIPGFTEDTFRNTISIEQLRAATDGELSSHVRNYITNLSIAKSKEVDVEKAIRSLKDQKKVLESIPYASSIESISDEIKKGIEREERIDSLTASLKELELREKGLRNQIEGLKNEKNLEKVRLIEEFPVILEKYNTYQELSREYNKLEYQRGELKDRISSLESEVEEGKALDNDFKEALTLDIKLSKYQNRLQELKIIEKKKAKETVIRAAAFIATLIVVGLVSFLLSKSYLLTGAALVVALIMGFTFLRIIYKRCRYRGCHDDNGQENIRDRYRNQNIKGQIEDINQAYNKAKNRIKTILDAYQLTSIHDVSSLQENFIKTNIALEHGRAQLRDMSDRAKELEDRCDGLHDYIMLYMRRFILEEELSSEAITRLKDFINIIKKEEAEKQAQQNKQLEECRIEIEKIKWELAEMEDNEIELIKNKELYNDIKQKQEENSLELDAINLALSTIEELSATIHDGFGMELNNAVSKLISEVTNNKYRDVKVDEKLNVKLGWKDNYIVLDRLSAGTIDQVYFALRLAVADLLLPKGNMPLILDDSFALYDDRRVKAALVRLVDRSQVLLFTCQMREKHFLDELGIAYNYISL